MREHELNSKDNFIMGWYIDPVTCDQIIESFKNNPNKEEGRAGVQGTINKAIKDSIDLTVMPTATAIPFSYHHVLKECFDEYLKKYRFSRFNMSIREPIKIQYYPPGGGYKLWHMERGSLDEPIVRRHLVFMTFLNDVTEGGGTEFLYQNLCIKAEKGLTLIWPAEWMFTHRGQVSHTQEKYIITGWLSLNS